MQDTQWVDYETLLALESLGESGEPADFVLDLYMTYRCQWSLVHLHLETAFLNSDREGIKFSAHSLKGSSFNIGAHGLAHLLEGLESECGAESFDSMGVRLKDIYDGYTHTCRVLSLHLKMDDRVPA